MTNLKTHPHKILTHESHDEVKLRKKLKKLFLNNKIPEDQIISNLGLFLDSKNLSRILLADHLFKFTRNVHGDIFEFGTRWGQNLSLFCALRGIYDPFNRNKKIIAFDTFKGFPSVHKKDGNNKMMFKGALTTTKNYEKFLNEILEIQEKLNPLSHIKKFEIIKGDAVKEFPKYILKNQHTIISLAYFDLDIYEPTKKLINQIKPRLVKGSVIVFDELNCPDSPGETLAVMETLGLNNIRLEKYEYTSRVSYAVID